MSAMSDYLEEMLLRHCFLSDDFPKPPVLAIALCTATTQDDDTGDLSTKEVPNSNGYSRQVLNPDDLNWSVPLAGDGTTHNMQPLIWNVALANWGTITHVALIDDDVWGQGNLLWHGALFASRTIQVGDVMTFNVGDLEIQIDD